MSVRESAVELLLLFISFRVEDMKVGQGLSKHAIPWFVGLVFGTGLSVTPLMCYLGLLASHWSVYVDFPN